MSEPIDLGLDSDEDHPRRLIALPGDEKHLLAFGGNDGTISLIDVESLKVSTARQFDDAVRDVAFSRDGERVAVGLDDGSTQIFLFTDVSWTDKESLHPFVTNKATDDFLSQDVSETTFQGPRFDAPVRSLQWDPRSNMLAIASEAGMCVIDATSKDTISCKDRFLQEAADKEHSNAGVRGLSYYSHESQTLLASIGLDGRLCIWDVTGDDPALDYELLHRDDHKCILKADVGELNGSDALDRSCLPVFGKTFLSLPGNTDVQVRSASRVEKQFFLTSLDAKGHIETIVALAVSNDNKNIVTSGRDGRVNLWEIHDKENILSGSFVRMLGHFHSVPTHMVWKSTALCMVHANGTFSRITSFEIFPTEKVKAKLLPANDDETAVHNRLDKNSVAASADSDDDIDFEENLCPSMKNKKLLVMDEADEDDDNSTAAERPQHSTMDDADDIDDGYGDDLDDFLENDMPVRPTRSTLIYRVEPQPAFAPSSTPLDLPRRILCWNHVGACTLLRGNDGNMNNIINIDFTDSAFRRPVSFTDNMHFILGSLGEDGGIFATDLADDDRNSDDVGKLVDELNMSERTKAAVRRSQSKRMKTDNESGKCSGSSIYFHRFETFGSLRDKDWYMTLPDGERALGCASGEGWAAVATSRRFLRLFTSGGNQGQILWLRGEPVALVGRSRFLAVFYHEATPLHDGTQKLGFMLYDAKAGCVITSGSLACISSRSSLSWAGFSNDFSLLVMDSDGMVSILVGMESPNVNQGMPVILSSYTWEWSPLLDTIGLRKSVDDSFWPVTSQDGKLVCVPLKGGIDHPDASRRPVTTTLSFRMPLARGLLENSSVLEEASVRANLALTQKKFLTDVTASDGLDTHDMKAEYDHFCANVDKVTLKLFHATVSAGKLERALDLCERLHLEKSFEIASRVADMANYRNLADRIDEAKERKYPIDMKPFDDVDLHGEVGHKDSDFDEESGSQRISPENDRLRNRSFDDIPDNEKVPDENTMFHNNKRRRKSNPFAKKRLESPGKKNQFLSPHPSPSKSIALSRLSSFSAQSREIRSPKNIL